MLAQILVLMGGVGLFLFGMQVLTDAIRQMANTHIRQILARFTTSPLTGALTGAATTAVIQSSSATMVTVIGFVGAGLMTFPQAIGVIYGANIGTTMTGWIVTLVGLKLKLGLAALPILFGASLLRILSSGRAARIGLALAGFALVFIGLDMMQDGAAIFRDILTPDSFPGDTFLGRLRLLLVGLIFTVVVQSSSAGIAMALVLMATGSIGLSQGAAMVIGMNVGTTVTGLMASIGGSRDMRCTAAAHVAYNVITGILAFALLGLCIPPLAAVMGAGNPAALVTFHTLFNVLGVAIMLPFTRPFARLIERLVPGKSISLTEALDQRLLPDPAASMDAATTAARTILQNMALETGLWLSPGRRRPPLHLFTRIHPALDELQLFIAQIQIVSGHEAQLQRYSALLHQYDHLHRLAQQLDAGTHMTGLKADPGLRRATQAFGAALLRTGNGQFNSARMQRLEKLIQGRVNRLRRSALLREHVGLISISGVFELTDSMRWLNRSVHNATQVLHYAELSAPPVAPLTPDPEPAAPKENAPD
ncbi:Na/Pi cotransporter family protein [Actibacterium sp.]|uniref:Na/Pi cotransporter family protein n=1 Tax=Actibacterium sp. TaxID=1872125 RepID=UPI00356342D5